MNTAALREQIQQAQAHEADSGALANQLQTQLGKLHPAIQLPDSDARGVLERFVAAYIEQFQTYSMRPTAWHARLASRLR